MDLILALTLSIILLYIIYRGIRSIVRSLLNKKNIQSCHKKSEEISFLQEKEEQIKINLERMNQECSELEERTAYIQSLSQRDEELSLSVKKHEEELNTIVEKINSLQEKSDYADKVIHDMQSRIDLYSRLEEFVDYGFYKRQNTFTELQNDLL